jgi:hypothetical protein
MKRAILLIPVFVCFALHSFSQASHDSILIKNVLGGYQYYQDNKRIKFADLVKQMESNEQAYMHIKKTKTNNVWTTVFSGIGGFLIGWPLGTALGGGDPKWEMAGIGAGLVVVSIPFSIKANKEARTAVGIYNEKYRSNSFLRHTEIHFAVGNNRVGLKMNF